MEFFFKLYKDLPKQGPGSAESTLRALHAVPNVKNIKQILDVGCGTGRHTILLAQETSAQITALEYYDEQISTLRRNIQQQKLAERIEIVKGDMSDLSLFNSRYDLIWSECSIYNIGFEQGLKSWRPFIRDTGYLVVSEAVWLTSTPTDEIKEWWGKEYPEMKTMSQIKDIIENSQYHLIEDFILPKSDWWEGYYDLLEKKAAHYKSTKLSEDERGLISMAQSEIDMFKKYSDQYGYAFFVLENSF